MAPTHTHTYAVLEVSAAAHREIRDRLVAAMPRDYGRYLPGLGRTEDPGGYTGELDVSGLRLRRIAEPEPASPAALNIPRVVAEAHYRLEHDTEFALRWEAAVKIAELHPIMTPTEEEHWWIQGAAAVALQVASLPLEVLPAQGEWE